MSHSNTNSDSVSDKVGMLCCEKGKGEPNCIVESELNSSEAQRHLVYNKVLPYSDKLDDESEKLLSEVKGNLGKAILMREIVPGTGYWTSHLVKYIRLYGRRFSKEDHIHFIKLVFELIIIPDLDLNVICHLAQLLNLLLKKKKLLSRAELEVPWRPLYNLYKNALDSSYEHLGMLLLPRNLEDTLKTMIRSCRVYFSVESTQEMLTEWRPLICPFDVTMNKAMMYFELFLPTLLGPDNYDKGFRLWFEEFMEIWDSFQNSPTWENSLVWLFSRLAHDNIGYIDWEPYIPKIFTRLLDSFNLPVGQNSVQVNRINSTFDVVPSVNWIASMLGGGSICQTHIDRFFKAVASFYHPSNIGRWMLKLHRFLFKLPAAVIKRLHREKYHFSWETPIPETSKLKEDDVTKFVESIKPVVLLSMFSKAGSTDSAAALQNLATVRPEIVIPPVLDRLYSSLETLTEPHRLTATMQCIVSVARALVQGSNRFPEGPSHVVPLLMGSLPGIDPNDIRKCMVTFQFISTFTTLIPLVDCSKAVQYHSDLTELEQEICLATAEFEDFVLQFMDRCFALIENSSLEHPARLDRDTEKMNLEENVLEIGLTSTFSSILTQSSPEIFKAALRKLYSFVSSHILETKVSGRFAANMCRSAARVNPEATLRLFLPHFCKLVITLTESEDVAKEEILDEELLFSLLLLSEVVRCNGVYLLQYRNYIESVLHRTLHLTNKQGYLLTGSLLRYTLKALTTVYPLDFRSTKMPVEDCCSLEQHLPIKDWGKPGDIKDLGVQWHLPSDEEISLAQDLLESFLKPELEELTKWKKQELSLTREELQRSLNIVHECVIGAGAALPVWKIEAIQLSDSFVPIHCSRVKEVGHKAIDFKDGRNIRQTVVSSLKEVLDHIMNTCEDDTKSLFLIIKIFVSLMIFWGVDKTEFDTRWKSFHVVKKALENKLVGSKQHIRALLVDRTLLQHEVRVLELQRMPFSTIHKELMNDLLRLATSHYSEVRIKAQSTLQACFRLFPLSYKIFLPDILNLLTVDTVVSHEKFKGSLFILLGQKQKSPLILHDWDVLKKTWPAIIKAQHSEKPSIINLLNQISENIQKYMNTPQLQLKVSANCLEAAMTLWCRTKPLPSLECPTDKEIEEGKQKELRKNEMNISNYQDLVKSLVDLIENGNLHWRHNHLALIMLKMLIRHDVAFPHEAVKLFAQHLVHDTLMMRKIAITAVAAILKQQKRCHVVETLDSSKVNVNSLQLHPALLESCGPLIDKPANLWLQYNSLSPPDTQEKWDNHQFVHKTHVGFYICDGQLKVYAPDSKQPLLDRQRADLSEGEMAIYDAFSNQQFVDQLMNYLSLEERKGQDKFDAKRFHMFKGLFRNFGDTFLPNFISHLQKKVADPQESSQRCASEVIAGLLRGSKHWNFQKMQSLKKELQPILRTMLSNITPDTVYDWGVSLATASDSRDPNKYHWLIELLMEDPLKGEGASFLEASQLYLLLGYISQQEWRVFEVLHRVLVYLRPHLTHDFQNVRDRIARLLSKIFMYDMSFPRASKCLALAPKRDPFIREVLPTLTLLTVESVDSNQSTPDSDPSDLDNKDLMVSTPKSVSTDSFIHNSHLNCINGLEQPEERKKAANLCKIVCKWLVITITRTPFCAPPEVFRLLRVLCIMQSDTTDDELQKECTVALAVMGQAVLQLEVLEAAISTMKQVRESNSWHARVAALSYLQVMVFSNLFMVMHQPQWVEEITKLVVSLLEDERVEVRETAAETLGGFLHCEFVKVTEELLESFKVKCRKKLKKRKMQDRASGLAIVDLQELTERHAGILGLCACVNAYPYDVPEFLPDVLVMLGDHLNDPQPIPSTIKKTLSNFRRTHHDSWRDHKLKFTDDQLAVITDLLVSPSYYA